MWLPLLYSMRWPLGNWYPSLPTLCSYVILVCCVKSLHSCLTPCDPMNCSPPGSCVHGIFQARILEWAAMPSSRGSPQPRDQTRNTHISCIGKCILYHSCHLGSPCYPAVPSQFLTGSRAHFVSYPGNFQSKKPI